MREDNDKNGLIGELERLERLEAFLSLIFAWKVSKERIDKFAGSYFPYTIQQVIEILRK